LSSGVVGTAYSVTLAATNSPTVWTVAFGVLPDGLTLDNSGVISGTPTTAGVQFFTVTAGNSFGTSVDVNFSITITAAGIATISVTHFDAYDGSIIVDDTYTVNAGAYGPYNSQAFPGYSPGTWDATSAPASGTVAAGQTLQIIYLYPRLPFAPTITGPTAMTLAAGYAATSSSAYSITGSPTPALTQDTDHGGAIVWNNATQRLDIAAGLATGTYPVVLTATNGVAPDAILTFTLTITAAGSPPVITLAPVSNITGSTADINWALSETADIYIAVWPGTAAKTAAEVMTPVGATFATAGPNLTPGGGYSFQASGFAQGTQYTVYFVADNANGTSAVVSETFITLGAAGAPTISGPTAMTLTVGYAATSTGAYTTTGTPAPTVSKTSGNAAITWNNATQRLDIAAGLATGTYTVVLTATNGVAPDAILTFTLTVNSATPPPPQATAPRITGPSSMKLTTGYAATSTDAYTITGTYPVTVTKTSGNDKITWNKTTEALDIAEGLTEGVYPVVLRASNTAGSYTFTFTLTVEGPVYWMEIPSSFPGGTVTSSPPYISGPGGTVTLTVTPDTGYKLESITVTDLNNVTIVIPLTKTGDNTYTFKMPAHHVRVTAVFKSDGTGVETQCIASLRAYAQNGTLYVTGLTPGNTLYVYNILGTLIYQGVANSDKAEIALPGKGVYIVTSNGSVIKITNSKIQ
jgi:hypothetical protein